MCAHLLDWLSTPQLTPQPGYKKGGGHEDWGSPWGSQTRKDSGTTEEDARWQAWVCPARRHLG